MAISILVNCRENNCYLLGRPISKDPASPAVFSLAASWLSECMEHHSCHTAATKSTVPTLPTRVVDVGSQNSSAARLLVSDSRRGDYLALSYCWGPGPHSYKLTKEKFEAFKQQIPISSVSKTISDAILITRQLGYRYLWVDALCIVQNDVEDWRRESMKMADVYGNAICIISATTAENSTVGCFPNRAGLAYPVSPCTISGVMPDGTTYMRTLMPSVPEWDVAVATAPINDRIWTFQERALSHRILHWTQHELFWECCEKRASETWVGELPNAEAKDATQPDTIWAFKKDDNGRISTEVKKPLVFQKLIYDSGFPFEKWWQVISIETSRRKRTVESDILPALSGLAGIVQSHSKDAYLAGLWRSEMPQSLFWRALNTDKRPLPEKHRPKDFLAPSWSWVSIVGEISFPDSEESSTVGYIPEIDIIAAKVSLINRLQPFGQVTGGILRLKGVLSRKLTAVHRYRTTGYYFETLIYDGVVDKAANWNQPASRHNAVTVIYDVTPPGLPLPENTQNQSLLLLRAYKPNMSPRVQIKALALEKVKYTRHRFRRIGWVDDCKQSWFHSQDLRVIEII